MTEEDESQALPDHRGCKGVLVKEHVGREKIQIRCQFCKKVLTRKELDNHGISEYYSEEDEKENVDADLLY